MTSAIDIEDVLTLKRVADAVISADGCTIAAVVQYEDLSAGRTRSQLWVFCTEGDGSPIELSDADLSVETPQWSPDGACIAVSARRADDVEPQIWLIESTGGQARKVTSFEGGARAPKWSPDGSRLYFLGWLPTQPAVRAGNAPRPKAEERSSGMVWDQGPVSHWDHYLQPRRLVLFALDLTTGVLKPILRDDLPPVDYRSLANVIYAVSPDGGEIAYVGQSDVTGMRPRTDIFAVEIASGAGRQLSPSDTYLNHAVAYSGDGRYLAWLRNDTATMGFVAGPERSRLVVQERRAAACAPSGALHELAPMWDTHPRAIAWAADDAAILCIAEERGTRRLFSVPLDGGAPRAVAGGGDIVAVAPGADAAIFAIHASLSAPACLVKLDADSGNFERLSTFDSKRLDAIEMGAVASVTYKGYRGAEVQMWLVKPPDFTLSRRYPLLLLMHGGPYLGVTEHWLSYWNAQAFAARGYVVAWHNFHGSSGFGEAFATSLQTDRTTAPYEDTIAAAGWFADQPWIDRERMAAAGGSFGGFLACTLLGRPHPFKALVAHAPVYNQYTQSAGDYAGECGYFSSFKDHADLQAQSPHMRNEQFETPMLLLHGLKDQRVPASQSIELFHTLQKRGVPARLVLYPDENHHILKPYNMLHWHAQVMAWVENYAPPGGRAT